MTIMTCDEPYADVLVPDTAIVTTASQQCWFGIWTMMTAIAVACMKLCFLALLTQNFMRESGNSYRTLSTAASAG